MNFFADDLALLLRLAHTLQGGEEVFGGVHGDELDAGRLDEIMLDLLGLALAQQTVVHEHAGELLADGLMHQSRRDGGVDAAGQAANHLCVADLLADFLDLVLDDVGRVPVIAEAGALVQEVLDELLAHRSVLDFRMPLHAVQFAGLVLHGGDRCAFGVGEHFEAFRRGLDGHAMAHPRALLCGRAVEQTLRLVDGGFRFAVFAQGGLVDIRAQRVCHGLEAVADAEHWNARVEQLLVDARSARFEHGSGATGQDDGLRILGQHLIDRHGMRHELRINIGLTHATCDQLGVLGSEIDNEHRTCSHNTLPFDMRYEEATILTVLLWRREQTLETL